MRIGEQIKEVDDRFVGKRVVYFSWNMTIFESMRLPHASGRVGTVVGVHKNSRCYTVRFDTGISTINPDVAFPRNLWLVEAES